MFGIQLIELAGELSRIPETSSGQSCCPIVPKAGDLTIKTNSAVFIPTNHLSLLFYGSSIVSESPAILGTMRPGTSRR
jgi:hypothetical protein